MSFKFRLTTISFATNFLNYVQDIYCVSWFHHCLSVTSNIRSLTGLDTYIRFFFVLFLFLLLQLDVLYNNETDALCHSIGKRRFLLYIFKLCPYILHIFELYTYRSNKYFDLVVLGDIFFYRLEYFYYFITYIRKSEQIISTQSKELSQSRHAHESPPRSQNRTPASKAPLHFLHINSSPSCCKHLCTNVCVNIYFNFSSVNTQEQNSWVQVQV